MRRGRIEVTNEIKATPDWPVIESELLKVMTFEASAVKPFGITEIHGVSELFDEAQEAESPLYMAYFKTVEGIPVFDKFVKA